MQAVKFNQNGQHQQKGDVRCHLTMHFQCHEHVHSSVQLDASATIRRMRQSSSVPKWEAFQAQVKAAVSSVRICRISQAGTPWGNSCPPNQPHHLHDFSRHLNGFAEPQIAPRADMNCAHGSHTLTHVRRHILQQRIRKL